MTTGTGSPTMTLAIHRFDRSAPLVDGRVTLNNILVIRVPGGPTCWQGFLSGAFDAAEMPLARYIFWKDRGDPFTAAPVFADRIFTFPYIYTRPDTGITSLKDLRGRRVSVAPSYFSTPSIWHRGILNDDFDITPQEIEWYTPTAEADGRAQIPSDVKVTVKLAPAPGLDLLLDGTVDCCMLEREVLIPPSEKHRVQRVYVDAHALQQQWYRRTGFFPSLHVVAIRNESLARRPDLGEEICRGYDMAKAHTYRVLQDERMTSLPFMRQFLDETVALCGDDPWPHGLERNRAEMDTLLRYSYEQGLTRRRLEVDELFDARAASYRFVSRMVPGSIIGVAEGGWNTTSVGLELR